VTATYVETELIHGVQNTSMDGFETVASVGMALPRITERAYRKELIFPFAVQSDVFGPSAAISCSPAASIS
jgi:hypothetical protein